MEPKDKEKNKDKVLEIIEKYDRKSQTQLDLSKNIIDLKNKIIDLSNQVSKLENEIRKKDLIIEKKDDIIERNSRKITELTSSLINLEKENKDLAIREAALLDDLQLFMKDMGDKSDTSKIKKDKLDVIPTEAEIKAKDDKVFKIKLIMLGEYSVGKTAFIKQFSKKEFDSRYGPTIGAEITKMRLRFKKDIVELSIWDVAGQIAFKSMADRFIQGANAVIFMYDVTRVETYQGIKDWQQQTIKVIGKKIPSILVGNKTDLKKERKISRDDGLKLAQEIDAEFVETSVKDIVNIKEALILLISNYMDSI